jgi:hypothetical protein
MEKIFSKKVRTYMVKYGIIFKRRLKLKDALIGENYIRIFLIMDLYWIRRLLKGDYRFQKKFKSRALLP